MGAIGNCNKNRRNCTTPISSECVNYQGEDLTSSKMDDVCDATINDIIFKLDSSIKTLQDKTTFDGLETGCLTFHKDLKELTNKEYNQVVIKELCGIKTDLNKLKTQLNSFNFAAQQIGIDLSCFGSMESCATADSKYTWIQWAQVITTELCSVINKVNANPNTSYLN